MIAACRSYNSLKVNAFRNVIICLPSIECILDGISTPNARRRVASGDQRDRLRVRLGGKQEELNASQRACYSAVGST